MEVNMEMNQVSFQSAKPIWLDGREKEKNLFVGFRVVFKSPKRARIVFRIAASSLYRCWLNGHFLGHGPARGPHGYFRVDEWELDPCLLADANLLAVEVAGYNVNSYYLLDQPSFLQAEIVAEGQVLASTNGAGEPLQAILLAYRLQKVQRYSFQRPFVEVYRLQPGYDHWRKKPAAKISPVRCAEVTEKHLIPRRVSLPNFALYQPMRYISKGKVQKVVTPTDLWREHSMALIGTKLGGFHEGELEQIISDELQTMINVEVQPSIQSFQPQQVITLAADSWQIVDFGKNMTGFLGVTITGKQPVKLYLTFDEILSDEDVNFKRLGCVNCIAMDLSPGDYEVETFEPYTLRYLKLLATDGACKISNLYLRELACPDAFKAHFSCSDHRLNDLFEAGRETFRQNALDIFMDCPSRERAGWLCDSFFTARVENDLCGNNLIEHNFLENFLLPESFPFLPPGMLPMCYPADHNDGVFIPNWSLWFVIQLEEYWARSGNRSLVDALKEKVFQLFDYFKKFQNSDGLLEKLESWVFVEWSKANEFVQDVNYPTNMLYAAALDSAGRIYGDTVLNRQAANLRQIIREQSFDGSFFVDNALRQDGNLVVTTNRSETCQYYAFYFHIASPETHSELWQRLRDQFGPNRKNKGLFPGIYPANALNGNFLRMELLSRYGCQRQLVQELKDYFLYMADRTGTLWENIDVRASCNHGFASHVAHILLRDVLGLYIDKQKKTITLQLTDPPLEWCEGRLPVGNSNVSLKWWCVDDTLHFRAQVPMGFSLHIENRSHKKIVQ
jgi:alpha-L-rhamnosidase